MKKTVFSLVSILFYTTQALADYPYYNQDNGYSHQHTSYRYDNSNAYDGRYNTLDLHPFIGVDYVYSKVGFSDEDTKEAFNDKFNSLSLSAGVKFGQYVGLEGFFQKSGDSVKKFSDDDLETTLSFYAYGADLAFYIPLISQYEPRNGRNIHYYTPVNLLAATGVGQYKTKAEANDMKIGHVSKTAPRFGLGMQFNFNDRFALRTMGRYVLFDDEDIDDLMEFTVGLRTYF